MPINNSKYLGICVSTNGIIIMSKKILLMVVGLRSYSNTFIHRNLVYVSIYLLFMTHLFTDVLCRFDLVDSAV